MVNRRTRQTSKGRNAKRSKTSSTTATSGAEMETTATVTTAAPQAKYLHTLIREVGYRKYKISKIRILPAQAPGESRCYGIRCFNGDSESNPQSSSGTRRKERYIRERTSRSKGVTRGAGESARHRLAPRTDPGHRLALD